MSSGSRCRGLAIALIGTLAISPDALLLRLVQSTGVTPPTLVFWRSTLVGCLSIGLSIRLNGGLSATLSGVATAPLQILLASLLQAGMTLGFALSILLTDAARALALLALNPLVATVLSWAILNEQLPYVTLNIPPEARVSRCALSGLTGCLPCSPQRTNGARACLQHPFGGGDGFAAGRASAHASAPCADRVPRPRV